MTQRHTHHSRIVTRFVRIPEPLEDGKIRCPGCSRVLKPTSTGRLRRHSDRGGDPCPIVGAFGEAVRLDEIPPVNVPPHPPKRNAWKPRPADQPSRLDAGSECSACGKWLPGERSLCGACYVERNGAR